MNISAPFIRRSVATTLLTLGLALAGALAFFRLPVAPLPQVDIPTIVVSASMPGASPDTMAATVATPLERHLGQIAGISEITSTSSLGSTRVILQFDLSRDADGAARDVQAAINAARADLPVALRSNPTYRKVNPADAPILVLALSSNTLTRGQLYDSAATVLQQKLSQVKGVGQVNIGGASLPAVRVEINPHALAQYGIGLEDVRAALSAANANAPKGAIEAGEKRWQIYTNDQAKEAAAYRSLIIAYRNNAAVRLSDVADVVDGVENIRNEGLADGRPSVLIMISREPGANIIETVDRIRALLPELKASIPSDIEVTLAQDRTATIRASVADVEHALILAVVLVVVVVFAFLRDARAAVIPCVAVPVSLLGSFAAMYLLGYSLDNFSLMALTIATGFVVDDAIVVLENVTRHIEAGKSRMEAALIGAKEVGFTVLSMTISLIAVFLPLLLMGGIVGRFFREFSVTLSVTILVSLLVSLTTTPMMCAYLLRERKDEKPPGRFARMSERIFAAVMKGYEVSLDWSLRHALFILLLLGGIIALNVHLFTVVPKGFMPQQDTGQLVGGIQADQSISFQLMKQKLARFVDIIKADPAVDSVVGYTGGGQTNSGYVFVSLKPLEERKASADQVIARLRGKLSSVPGAVLYLQAMQDVRAGGRQSNAQYQFTLQSDDLEALREWTPKITEALRRIPQIADVNSDTQEKGLEVELNIDRDTAAKLGLSMSQISNTLYDAFGQRQVSTIYAPLNQYHVVMEVAPAYWQDPRTLDDIRVSTTGGALAGSASTAAIASTLAGSDAATDAIRNANTNRIANTTRSGTSTGAAVSTRFSPSVPLSAFATFGPGSTPLSVNHQGLFAATTISFNLPEGRSLSDATDAIHRTMMEIGVPANVHGTFQGTAQLFQKSLSTMPLLILLALATVYIVLGILYESFVHPITILSTLPSAGLGAFLALIVCRTEFSLIALIGVILLIGIVKKNAIMMVDFALEAERGRGLAPREAIREACLQRFRPILMTTLAAIFGALPLALANGTGAEMRQPLGISIIGGLLVSQLLTLYSTPVVYLWLDRLRRRDRQPRLFRRPQPAE
ncbi:transport system membrane protein [Azorhizobium oxalatiphilum]|uniref:Transport system membrane protein n=1 Tax=Azorhizobium oxalatiphilum TaxID=980631 RepID=A0A917BZ63_9HYPH|nr:efflux RND transporter permease subunit [Azorhizobium oxalatiphilum]GGF61107.1 transport system membrane protein [Azorhizobium oxalatiphilum]